MRVAVVGATGRIGRLTVGALERMGHDTVAISRAQGIDVYTGEGLAIGTHRRRCRGRRVQLGSDRPRRGSLVLQRFGSQPARSRAADRGATPCAAVDRRPREIRRERPLLRQAGAGAARRARPCAWSIVPATHFHDFAEMLTTWTEQDGSATIAPALVQRSRPPTSPTSWPRSPSDRRRGAARTLPGPSRRIWSISRGGPAPLAAPRSDWSPPGRASSASTWPATCCCPARTRASLPRRSTTGSPPRRRPKRRRVRCSPVAGVARRARAGAPSGRAARRSHRARDRCGRPDRRA